jgi:hypothetical protein
MIPTRRRRRYRGSIGPGGDVFLPDVPVATTVNISPQVDGSWLLRIDGSNPGAGTYSVLTAASSPAPSGGPVQIVLEVDGGGDSMMALITAGTTTASTPGPMLATDDAVATAATGAGNTVSISGTVTFTRTSDGHAFSFAMQPFSLVP